MSNLTIKATIQGEGFNGKTFQGKKGEQQTMDFLISWYESDYEKQLVLTAWNKTIEEMKDAIGTGERTFHIEVTSRKSTDRYFTTAKVWRIV